MKAEVRTNLKPSGNEFIDGIPADWQAVPMKSLGWYASSGIDKKEQEDEPSVFMVNYMDIYGNASREISSSRPLMSTTCPAWKIKECSLQKGDLVFTPSSETAEDIGLSALITEDLRNTVFSYHVLRFRFTNPVDQGFKKYLCNNSAVLHQFSSVCQGSTRQILNRGEFRNAMVVIPPPAEQRTIAVFLDRETGRMDRLVAKKLELIERLKEKRTALISCAVTRGLPPAAARAAGLLENPLLKPSGHDWLGDIPAHWGVWKFTHFNPITTCGVASTPEYVDEGVPFLSAQNIKKNKVLFENHKYISPEAHAILTRNRRPLKGDVLLSRVGTIGEAAIVPDDREFSIFVSLTHIRVDPRICLNRYLVCYFGSAHFQQYVKVVTLFGGGVGNFNVNDLRELRVPLPDLPEQAAIVAYLDEQTAKLDALVAKVETAVERLLEYRTALITAAVTGKIDIRKESAS